MSSIEFYYDFGSPNAYLVNCVLPGIAARHSKNLIYKPMLLGGVFKATNNRAPMQTYGDVRNKLPYLGLEMQRFCERFGTSFAMNPHFPVNTLNVMRGAMYAEGKPWENSYIQAIFDALWLEGSDTSDAQTLSKFLAQASLPVDEILTAIQNPAIKEMLIGATEDAVTAGVFGAPSVIYDGELFFGKDALDDLDWRLGQT